MDTPIAQLDQLHTKLDATLTALPAPGARSPKVGSGFAFWVDIL
jgi:hypothetical protein